MLIGREMIDKVHEDIQVGPEEGRQNFRRHPIGRKMTTKSTKTSIA